MSRSSGRRSSLAAFLAGMTLGVATSAGTALLLYTGQGFLRAAGLLISSTLLALAAGLWAGVPEQGRRAPLSLNPRWLALSTALLAAGIFAQVWSGSPPLRGHALGGALAVLLALALPAYGGGSLLAGMHARRPRGSSVGSAALAGSAIGVLLATTILIRSFDPPALYLGAAALIAAASILDRGRAGDRTFHGANDMTDRVVIVTGVGAEGQLGWTIARRFLEAGARVVISGRSREAADALSQYGEVHAVAADLTNDDDVAALIDAVRDRHGRLDALINTAGGLSVIASVEDTSPDEWQREIERNAGTVLRVTRAALPLLRESRGAVVSFTSPAAMRAPARLAAYSAAKAAVMAITRSLAIEEKRNGVRVNAIAPGMMDTAQNMSGAAEGTVFVPREDVASVALFLASPASAGITGETIQVEGLTIA